MIATAADHPALQAPAAPPWLSGRALAGWWVLAGVFLLTFIGGPPVQRTQEARVLETAREMRGGPLRGWLIPQLNGTLRLRKPPLTYWLAAGAYAVGGVNETAGRVPTALVGWLTVGVTFLAGRRLYGRRAGFFAAAALVSSYLFFRHNRLAETDAPAALFVTCAVYAILRAAGGGGRPGHAAWLHAAAATAGLAFMSKGGPGLFPLLFLLGYAAALRRWDVARRFVTTGAVLTLLVVGASWYAYAAAVSGPRQFFHELRQLSSGEDHSAPLYLYFPQLLVAAAPWSGVVVVGLVQALISVTVSILHAFRRVRQRGFAPVGTFPPADERDYAPLQSDDSGSDPASRTMVVWCGSVFLPLCVAGNKQFHYLLPLMPPLMILAGWVIDAACAADDAPGFPGAGRTAMRATVLLSVAALVGLPWAARYELGHARPADLVIAAGLLTVLACAVLIRKAGGRAAGVAMYAAGTAAALAVLVGVWFPSLKPNNARAVARQIGRQIPGGSYCFFGGNLSLPLCFNLRTEIPQLQTAGELAEWAKRHDGGAVIAQTKDGRKAPVPADPADGSVRFLHVGKVLGDEQVFELYRVEGKKVGSEK